jgi:hypothetical protein
VAVRIAVSSVSEDGERPALDERQREEDTMEKITEDR